MDSCRAGITFHFLFNYRQSGSGLCPGKPAEKGQLWRWGLAAQSQSGGAEEQRQHARWNTIMTSQMLQLHRGNGERNSDNLFCFFPISAEKERCEGEGCNRKWRADEERSKRVLWKSRTEQIEEFDNISDSLLIIAEMCPASIIALSVRTTLIRSMKYVINKTLPCIMFCLWLLFKI